MARLITSGFDIAPRCFDSALKVYAPDLIGVAGGGQGPGQGTGRIAGSSIGWDSALTNTSGGLFYFAGSTNTSYFTRFWYKVSASPSAVLAVASYNDSANTDIAAIRLNTSRQLELFVDSNVRATSATLSTGVWYRVDFKLLQSTTAGQDIAEMRLDGIIVGTYQSTFANSANAPEHFRIGPTGVTTNGVNVDYDDLAINDSTGSFQNDYPEAGGVIVLCKPVSDSQRGSWTGGVGGTTNLWDAVDNTPPTGTAAETDTTQIESADSSGDNSTDEYRANLTTYTNASIPSGGVVSVIQPFACHGEDIATNSKTGSFGLTSNPAQAGGASETAFTFGDNVGALGTWWTNWRWTRGTVEYNPSVTLGNNPILTIRKTDTGTRVASVCFMGMYVEYYVPEVFEGQTYQGPKIYPPNPVQQRSRW